MEVDRRAFIASLGGTAAVSLMDHEAKAEAMEHWMEERLDELVEQQGGTQQKFPSAAELEAQIETRSYRRGVGNLFVNTRGGTMKKLPPIPKNATLNDFFELRFMPANHVRSEEHTSELQSQSNLVCRLLLEKKNNNSSHSSQ